MGALSITLMGLPQLWHDGQPLANPSRKVLLLLSYLLLEPGRHARDELAGLFWPDSEPDVARSALRTALVQLRRLLPDRLSTDGPLVELQLPPNDHVDVLSDDVAPSDQPFLLGVEVLEEGELQDWLTAMRNYLQRQQRARLQKHAQQLERSGQFSEALAMTERWFALDRTDEDATRFLMTLAGQLGDSEQLREVYERHRHALAQQLDAQPSTQLQSLLADLQAELIQTGPVDKGASGGFGFPPLPVRVSSFVGRQKDLAQLRALMAGGARLVTLQGFGGIGKTRLALELGATLQASFPERVAFVPLETVLAPEAIPGAILTALGLDGVPGIDRVIQVMKGQPSVLILDNFEQLLDGTDLVDTLLTRCPSLRLLVTSREVLNLQQEHRYPVPGLTQGVEEPGPDASLTAPSVSDAAQLFLQRARQVRADFAWTATLRLHIEQVCRLLGGAPLAIELAASWLKVLSVEELLHDLSLDLDVVTSTARNVPARQHSLRAVFEYSWARLSPSEQQALARLSVFRGGFTREAAREVTGASIQTLARLVDVSLLQVDRDGRFERHPLIFQYTLEKLEGSGEAEHVRERHAKYFVTLGARAFPHLATASGGPWLDRLEAEQQNLTLALEHLRGTGQAQALLGLCADLALYWRQRGHEGTGRQWLRKAILHAGAAVGTLEYARAQCMQGSLFTSSIQVVKGDELQWLRDGVEGCRRGGDQQTLAFGLRTLAMWPKTPDEEAGQLVREAIQISETLGDTHGLVYGENALGYLALRSGEYDEAEYHLERALNMAQGLADPVSMQWPLANLAVMAARRADYQRAVQLYQTALSVRRQLGMASGVAKTTYEIASSYLGLGDFNAARSSLQQALEHYRHQGQNEAAAAVLMNLAWVEVFADQLERADQLLQNAEREIGAEWPWPDWTLATRACLQGRAQQPEAARTTCLTVMGRSSVTNDSELIRAALEQYLTSPHPAADLADLARLLGVIAVFDKAHGISFVPPQSRADYEAGQQRIAERARNELGEAAFEQLVDAARRLPLAEAAELVRRHADSLLKTAPPVP